MLDATTPAPPVATPVAAPAAEPPFGARTPFAAAVNEPVGGALSTSVAARPTVSELAAPRGAPTAGADGLWVTVFGYSSNAMLSAVLDEVRPSGSEIIQHRLGVGPWVHVQFREWREQQQALAKNGKVLGGVMLGVIEGIVPSDDVLRLPAGVGGGGVSLKLQLPRTTAPTTTLRAPTAPVRDHGRAGWWTRLCEYVFGW